MDYENEFDDIINAVKNEIKAQQEAQNLENSSDESDLLDLSSADTSSDTNPNFSEFIEHSSDDETGANFDEILLEKAQKDAIRSNDEIEFLSAIKERILVLFEGLNAFEGDLEARVELSIKFMEFLLASIDNRVENLSK